VYALRDGTLVEVLDDGDGRQTRRGIAVGPDGTLYVVSDNQVLAVRDGGPEPVAGNDEARTVAAEQEDQEGRPALETWLDRPHDVAVTDDGSLFISTTDGIRRVGPDGVIHTVLPAEHEGTSAHSASDLQVGPGGDLYFRDTAKNQVRVLVRPAEIGTPSRFPWTTLWITTAALALITTAALVYRRRLRGREQEPAPEE
jgi:glucose/arabinose dehydrogenase